MNSVGLSKGKCILKGECMFIENSQRSADAVSAVTHLV
jgi:hypothetical protein